MKLIHWSADKVTKVHGRHQETLLDQRKPDAQRKRRRGGFGKPVGFWISDESRGAYGWRAWCRDNSFRSHGFRYKHEVVLSPKAKILYLRTPEDIDKFADKYGSNLMEMLGGRSAMSEEIWGGKYIDVIDWHRVAKKYHGIIITPYQWSQRMGRHMWYYGWDCASGCIWNARAIESVFLMQEYTVPHKPTYWEQRRASKRNLERMRKATEVLQEATLKLREPSNATE